MFLWLAVAAVFGVFRMDAIEPETMAGTDQLGWSVLLAGGAGGLTSGWVFLLARRWIVRERVPMPPPL